MLKRIQLQSLMADPLEVVDYAGANISQKRLYYHCHGKLVLNNLTHMDSQESVYPTDGLVYELVSSEGKFIVFRNRAKLSSVSVFDLDENLFRKFDYSGVITDITKDRSNPNCLILVSPGQKIVRIELLTNKATTFAQKKEFKLIFHYSDTRYVAISSDSLFILNSPDFKEVARTPIDGEIQNVFTRDGVIALVSECSHSKTSKFLILKLENLKLKVKSIELPSDKTHSLYTDKVQFTNFQTRESKECYMIMSSYQESGTECLAYDEELNLLFCEEMKGVLADETNLFISRVIRDFQGATHFAGVLITQPSVENGKEKSLLEVDDRHLAAEYLNLESLGDLKGFLALVKILDPTERLNWVTKFNENRVIQEELSVVVSLVKNSLRQGNTQDLCSFILEKNQQKVYIMREMENFQKKVIRPLIPSVEDFSENFVTSLLCLVRCQLNRKQLEAEENKLNSYLSQILLSEQQQISFYQSEMAAIEDLKAEVLLRDFVSSNCEELTQIVERLSNDETVKGLAIELGLVSLKQAIEPCSPPKDTQNRISLLLFALMSIKADSLAKELVRTTKLDSETEKNIDAWVKFLLPGKSDPVSLQRAHNDFSPAKTAAGVQKFLVASLLSQGFKSDGLLLTTRLSLSWTPAIATQILPFLFKFGLVAEGYRMYSKLPPNQISLVAIVVDLDNSRKQEILDLVLSPEDRLLLNRELSFEENLELRIIIAIKQRKFKSAIKEFKENKNLIPNPEKLSALIQIIETVGEFDPFIEEIEPLAPIIKQKPGMEIESPNEKSKFKSKIEKIELSEVHSINSDANEAPLEQIFSGENTENIREFGLRVSEVPLNVSRSFV